ncbi:MerR family transcriptional regulator [Streptomyces sp. NBC_01224]|uniref:MerR family transcriptional regulator n=1 Tax=Streptomyces sp. NBC_01224 TaxID=2903783 RepID=UPI002E0FB60C|nr:MerR family transcriptional regulator [Streptomyces sp. NBC_01224]
MAGNKEILSIGQVAERTGLSVHALRFYEQEGVLVNPVPRGPGGRRVYSEQDVDWLNLCIILRASGMPLPEIRRYTELARQGAGNEQERIELLRRHQDQVADQMKQLEQCRDLINFKVRVYEDILDGAGGHSCDAAVQLGNEDRCQTTEPLETII